MGAGLLCGLTAARDLLALLVVALLVVAWGQTVTRGFAAGGRAWLPLSVFGGGLLVAIALSPLASPADGLLGEWLAVTPVGVFRGLPKADATQPLIKMIGDQGSAETTGAADYEGIIKATAEFFHTGRSPVDVAETIEVFEFMTAAQLSKERGGADVVLAELRK